jgi:hypothetical protein
MGMIDEMQRIEAERARLEASRPHFCKPNCDWRGRVDSAPQRVDGRWIIETTCGKCGRWLGNRPAGTKPN